MNLKKSSRQSESNWCGWPKRPNHGIGVWLPTTAKEYFKISFLKLFKYDARLIGGIVNKQDVKYIHSVNSIKEIIDFFTVSFFKEYPK